jgi:hypothetical protein
MFLERLRAHDRPHERRGQGRCETAAAFLCATASPVRQRYLVRIAFRTLPATSGGMVGMLWVFFACSAAFAVTSLSSLLSSTQPEQIEISRGPILFPDAHGEQHGSLPEYEAKRYEGHLKSSGVLLSVHCDTADQITRAKGISAQPTSRQPVKRAWARARLPSRRRFIAGGRLVARLRRAAVSRFATPRSRRPIATGMHPFERRQRSTLQPGRSVGSAKDRGESQRVEAIIGPDASPTRKLYRKPPRR